MENATETRLSWVGEIQESQQYPAIDYGMLYDFALRNGCSYSELFVTVQNCLGGKYKKELR